MNDRVSAITSNYKRLVSDSGRRKLTDTAKNAI